MFNQLPKNQSIAGVAILLAVVIAMVWANSPWNSLYTSFVGTEISLEVGDFHISESLLEWVNDAFMAIFFLKIGLELKREILVGELSSPRQAILPIGAALGGMVVPAIFYLIFNIDSPAGQGWGIPMATDIAFALGVLSLFGKRVPLSLKVFLVAFATVDDLGSVLVIALFYTSDISYMDLFHGVLFFFVLLAASGQGIRKAWFYALVGITGVWLSFFFSGVHPTIAGILTAFAIPGKVKLNEKDYLRRLEGLRSAFANSKPIGGTFISEEQLAILEKIKKETDDAETPVQKIERHLEPVVNFFILPLFALVNTGIHIEGDFTEIFTHPIALGIASGLILGKIMGILGVSWLLVKVKLTELPPDVSWKHLAGVSAIGGIGFTMSLFVTELAFTSEQYIIISKLSILITSLLAGILGAIILYFATRNPVEEQLNKHR